MDIHFEPALKTSYNVSFMGQSTLQFTNIACSMITNQCSLTVNGSQLTYNDRYFIIVTASHAISSGSSTIFPNQSELIIIIFPLYDNDYALIL